jgi:hypothetical protein
MAQPAASPGSRAAPGRSAGRTDRRWLILVVVALAQLMVVLDATIVNIALPSAQHSLGFADSDRQWVVTAYALAFRSRSRRRGARAAAARVMPGMQQGIGGHHA